MAQNKQLFVGEVVQGSGTDGFVLGQGKLLAHDAFVDVLADGDTVLYRAKHVSKNEFEIGLGTYDSDTKTLARTTVLRSSAAADAKVSFSGGAVVVSNLADAIAGIGYKAYTVTNGGTATRSISGTETTAANIAIVVATLVSDLQALGVLK